MSDAPNFKTIVVGDSGVGKTAFVERHFRDMFPLDHEATVGSKIYPITISSTLGPLTFSCWDIAGREELGGFRGAYYAAVECLLIFYDMTSRDSFSNIPKWFYDVSNYAECDEDEGVGEEGGVPVVIVGAKFDEGIPAAYLSRSTDGQEENEEEKEATRKPHVREVDFDREAREGFTSFGPKVASFFAKYSNNIKHVELSSLNKMNMNAPFVSLAQMVFKQPTLSVIDAPSL